MKSLLILTLCAFVYSCSEDNLPLTPLKEDNAEVNVPIVVDSDREERINLKLRDLHIPYDVERHFIDFLGTEVAAGNISDAQCQDTMWQVSRYLQRIITYDTLRTHLRKTVPEIYEDVLDILHQHLRAAYATPVDRIIIASVLAHPDRTLYDAFVQNGPFHVKPNMNTDDHMMCLQWEGDVSWIFHLPNGGYSGRQGVARHVVELNSDGYPIDPKYKDWVVSFRDAPRATDAQVLEYQNKYGCLDSLGKNLWYMNNCHQNPGQPMDTFKALHDDRRDSGS